MNIVGLIPARYSSTRLPGKALAEIAGQPMVWHVYQRARQAPSLSRVIVATDDERILRAVQERGGEAVMTRADHLSGTDRLAEVARGLDCDLVVNLQGDEPLMDPAVIEAAVAPFRTEPELRLSTAATPIRDAAEYRDPAAVKVVLDERGYALYFSRSPLPFFRLDSAAGDSDNTYSDRATGLTALKHLGLYVYRRDTLLWLSELPPTALEQAEKLEQLRALGHGCPLRVVVVDYSPLGVDTPEDLEQVRRIMEA
ncbi:MAG TPA: 3-deoxy-manno-octulosonate cytidylyltransferase [Armatimonadota bacterium]|jgi:3-deoxy-manno-octulosonate cytidylyltransferase (CMP-KDO synthetase)